MFRTVNILTAGDLNAVLSLKDLSSGACHQEKNLQTAAWNHRGFPSHKHSGANKPEISYLLSPKPQSNLLMPWSHSYHSPNYGPRYYMIIAIFDQAWIQASFGRKREKITPTIKDYVLWSVGFLIQYYRLIEEKLFTCVPLLETAFTSSSLLQIPLAASNPAMISRPTEQAPW